MAALRITLTAFLVSIAACEPYNAVAYHCWNPDKARIDGNGMPDPCPSETPVAPGPANGPCQGDCVLTGTADFQRLPVLLWSGPPDMVPDCPDQAPNPFYTGHAGLIVSGACPECKCGPAPCVLPGGVEVFNGQSCAGPDMQTFDAPQSWDGQCASPSVIAAGSFDALQIKTPTISGCVASSDPPPNFTDGVSWTFSAVACDGQSVGQCNSPAQACVPRASPPPGFRHCIYYSLPVDELSLPECPVAFPDRLIFYSHAEDQRACTECTCGAPVGGKCVASVSTFETGDCSGNSVVSAPVTLGAMNACVSPVVGFALGGMSASWLQNEPGQCEAKGGEMTGTVNPKDPRLFCCKPSASE
jgi:hypothetical protein